jgi:hypothetical protein
MENLLCVLKALPKLSGHILGALVGIYKVQSPNAIWVVLCRVSCVDKSE